MEEERPLALGQTCVDKVNFERIFRHFRLVRDLIGGLKAMIPLAKSVTIGDVD